MIWLKALQSRLITHFFIEQWHLTACALSSTSRRYFFPSLVLGRDHTQYLCIDLEHVPKPNRTSALKHQVELKSQWKSIGYCVCWVGGIAQVWCWDSELLASQLGNLVNNDHQFQKASYLSEVVYWRKPESDGAILFQVSDGFDLQYWRGGVLRASQWMPVKPTDLQISRFFRAQGLAIPWEPLEPILPEPMEDAWAGLVVPGVAQWYEHRYAALFGLVACSIVIATLQITSIISWSVSANNWRKQTEELEKTASDLINARTEARTTRVEILQLHELFNIPDALTMQFKVYQRLPVNEGLALQTWERNFDQVTLLIKGKIPDTLSMVQALQRDGIVDVTVEPQSSGKYKIQLKLDGYSQQLK
jgi:hypothetical protein